MLFSSVTFLFYFLPLFLLLYFCLPSFRDAVLLIFSLAFYAWGEPRYVSLLLAFIVVNWACGMWLDANRAHRKAILTAGIACNLCLLIVFKYVEFIFTQLNAVRVWFEFEPATVPSVPLALGVSFFTFQGISYLVDVFRGDVRAQRSLFKFATYKAMFPPLLAGPIVRYAEVAKELERRKIAITRIRLGILVFVVGLAQKTLIADAAAVPADAVFAMDPGLVSTAMAWAGAAAYMVQIYFDFAGYSNMAIGLGYMLGFSFPRNFNRPYIATSVTEFWRRWHISLSSWFRDYLYIPLGGNRLGVSRTYLNLIVVFLLCGLWHGANWTFVVWGAYHGAFLVMERMGLARLTARLWSPLRHAYLLLVIAFGWVLFRSPSLSHAVGYLTAMFGAGSQELSVAHVFTVQQSAVLLAAALFAAARLPREREIARWLQCVRISTSRAASQIAARLCADAASLALLIISVITLAAATYRPFIYFRF